MYISKFFIILIAVATLNLEFSETSSVPGRIKTSLFDIESGAANISKTPIPLKVSTWLRFVVHYATWSQWEAIVFFFSDSSNVSTILPSVIFHNFNFGGIYVAIHFTSRHFLPKSIIHYGQKLGIVYFCDVVDEPFLNQVSEFSLFDAYRSWLIIRPESASDKSKLDEVLNSLKFGLDSNIVLATIQNRANGGSIVPLSSSQLQSPALHTEREIMKKKSRGIRKRELTGDPNVMVYLVQVYKADPKANNTIKVDLGHWDVSYELLRVKPSINVEQRVNLGGYKLQVGVKNSSQNIPGRDMIWNQFSVDGEVYEQNMFMELFDCLMFGVNVSFELVQFPKLGWRNEEGGWTHLLGGVVDKTVDFALETINVNLDKSEDMSFTYAIVTTMSNIYFRRPSSGGMRDIFLAAFSFHLLLCVLSTSILLAISMVSVSVVNYHLNQKKGYSGFQRWTKMKKIVTKNGNKKWKFSDAALWSVSILCMQGGQWSPRSMSGNLILISGLLFALIIYNSFAAFITSVLSIKDVKIKDLKDLAASDFSFGYTLDNADELYLRTVNDTLLRELYFKGLRENDGVSDSIAGMHRATKGKYAFFVAARTARRALKTAVAHDMRCLFQELYLPMTKNYASIPMTRKSSLKKIVNFRIIRLMEMGLLQRFQSLLHFSMPRCLEKNTFNSARLADVYSAFFVLIVGWIASILILGIEILWWKRTRKGEKDEENFWNKDFDNNYQFYWAK